MSEYCVRFQSPTSKEAVNDLVVEYLKFVLYCRGQFPMPLEQLKKTIPTSDKTDSLKIDNHNIYFDDDCRPKSKSSSSKRLPDRKKQVFIDSIKMFDEFFSHLLIILQNEDVLEIVMNLGPNMMNPRELHRIAMPKICTDSPSASDCKSFRRYRIEFFKTLCESAVLQDTNFENPIPISVLLRLKDDVALKEYMEQKRFYTPPQKCKQVLLIFDDSSNQDVAEISCFRELISNENNKKSDLWVKLKSDLKGFRSFIDTQDTLSSNVF